MAAEIITIPESFTFPFADEVYTPTLKLFQEKSKPEEVILDFSFIKEIDSSGVAVVSKLQALSNVHSCRFSIRNCPENILNTIKLFELPEHEAPVVKTQNGFFERTGQLFYNGYRHFLDSLILFSNIFYWSVIAFFKKNLRRRGEVVGQSLQIGVNALPIIALIAFLIGLILALQSAAQLRQFGANIYVADLVAIALVSEMGPLITAIMVAGRSGSAIAAEIATMNVNEEIDALKVMGIDPLPYLVVPKLYAGILTVPLLTIFANLIGILGGLLIGITYLDLDVLSFYNEVMAAIRYKEIIISLIKSFLFAIVIVLTATYFGLKAKGGAEEVGKATTASVVVSIFMVIVTDSLIGLLFYFGEPAF